MLIKSQGTTLFEEIVKIIYKERFSFTQKKYEKNQLIFAAQTPCDKIGIILEGEVSIEHVSIDGSKTIINMVSDCFGEILIFTDERLYPYNVVSYKNCEILFISKEILFKIFKVDMTILERYLQHISMSYMVLNRNIKLKSQKTIINKFAYYLVHYLKIQPQQSVYKLTTKTAIAQILGVERQSLIRELNKLKAKQIVDFNKQTITIHNFEYLFSLVE